ncbi:heavy-metal-associated domain-containing protein [Leucobacter sp. CSA2]|uniref:Heavy-metal-associated domain-containing protein n=1 Tax=Leucobacter edaphi TaxID=2796472 RepID=A0A934QCH7_9MICO|nr:cation transporter [Leucobacter edaphi]MBK0421943.1 heavy-metal-associated domain-containing protein [Leucobacter edaphi]
MSDTATTTEFTVTGMSCGHCEGAIRAEVSEIPGVSGVEVSAASGILRVTRTAEVSDEAIVAAVDEAGYDAARS